LQKCPVNRKRTSSQIINSYQQETLFQQAEIPESVTAELTVARTTSGDLQRATAWVWQYCEPCRHHSPLACAVAVTRWGANTSSDKLRQSARCTACGQKGATIQHPGWGGEDIGFLPFLTR
jgi:hypothetical protein